MGSLLGGERNGSFPGERLRQPCEDREISVKMDAGESADAERGDAVFVLQPVELALNGGAPCVQ